MQSSRHGGQLVCGVEAGLARPWHPHMGSRHGKATTIVLREPLPREGSPLYVKRLEALVELARLVRGHEASPLVRRRQAFSVREIDLNRRDQGP